MKQETIDIIKRNNEILKARIASGDILVCDVGNPMPENRDQMGQKWFHEKAVAESSVSETKTEKVRIYHCPVCDLRFSVTLQKIQPHS